MFQLTPFIIPLAYDITLEIRDKDQTFSGSEQIIIDVANDVDKIVLNCAELSLSNVKLNEEPVENITYDEENQTVTLHIAAKKSEYILGLEFVGKINSHCSGIYSGDIENQKYFATHFEPLKARYAFPCFDEPQLRSNFTLHLVTDNSGQVISNSPINKIETLTDGLKKVTFDKTPPMSTYLVAFAIGNFVSKSYDTSGTELKIWTTPDSQSQCDFAGDVAVKALQFFEKIFEIPYPLKKLDLVGVPNFGSSAMENFGAIFFKENCLLIDEDSSQYAKEEVAETIFHEIAHQWFGNLVCLNTWDDLWLKEAFATWFSWYAIDEFFPSWKTWESYIVYTLQSSLMSDGREENHAVFVPKNSIHDVCQNFDNTTYKKGCALVTMLSKWLGEDIFMKGISRYLKKWAWKSTSTKDLWDCFQEASGVDVEKFMSRWVCLPGFPVVFAEEQDGKLQFHQKRFVSSGQVLSQKHNHSYPVFLNIKYSNSIDNSKILDSDKLCIKVPEDDFYKVNSDSIGFFRVAYSDERWEKLGVAGLQGKLSVNDKIGLLADSCQLSTAGIVPIASFFKLVENWSNERNVNVLDEILNDIYTIMDTFIDNDRISKGLEQFLFNLVKNHIEESLQGGSDDSFEESLFKTKIFSAGYTANSPRIVDYCRSQFDKFISESQPIDSDLRPIVFKSIARNGDPKATFESFKQLYLTSKLSIREDVLNAMGRFEDQEILNEVIDFLIENVPPEDFILTLLTMKNHKPGITKLWNWLQNDWNAISELCGPETHLEVTESCLWGLSSKRHISEVENFFKDKGDEFKRISTKAIENITIKSQWVERDEKTLEEWMMEKKYIK